VTRFHGNVWVAVMGLVEAAVARQQGKRACAGQQHATVGRALLSVLSSSELYTNSWWRQYFSSCWTELQFSSYQVTGGRNQRRLSNNMKVDNRTVRIISMGFDLTDQLPVNCLHSSDTGEKWEYIETVHRLS
jgi:hypothetical protein